MRTLPVSTCISVIDIHLKHLNLNRSTIWYWRVLIEIHLNFDSVLEICTWCREMIQWCQTNSSLKFLCSYQMECLSLSIKSQESLGSFCCACCSDELTEQQAPVSLFTFTNKLVISSSKRPRCGWDKMKEKDWPSSLFLISQGSNSNKRTSSNQCCSNKVQ